MTKGELPPTLKTPPELISVEEALDNTLDSLKELHDKTRIGTGENVYSSAATYKDITSLPERVQYLLRFFGVDEHSGTHDLRLQYSSSENRAGKVTDNFSLIFELGKMEKKVVSVLSIHPTISPESYVPFPATTPRSILEINHEFQGQNSLFSDAEYSMIQTQLEGLQKPRYALFQLLLISELIGLASGIEPKLERR